MLSLCHVSFDGICEYARNLFPRMRKGALGVWMVADYRKYNEFVAHQDCYNVLQSLLPRRRHPLIRKLLNLYLIPLNRWNAWLHNLPLQDENEDEQARPGRWYDAG
jgi:hypothetical protein